MTADVIPLEGDRYLVRCRTHGALSRVVDTPEHAANLANLHNRVDHDGEEWEMVKALTLLDPVDPEALWEPGEVDLTAAAKWVLMLGVDSNLAGEYRGALGAWCELLGAPDDETALAYAERLFTADRVTAHVNPF